MEIFQFGNIASASGKKCYLFLFDICSVYNYSGYNLVKTRNLFTIIMKIIFVQGMKIQGILFSVNTEGHQKTNKFQIQQPHMDQVKIHRHHTIHY